MKGAYYNEHDPKAAAWLRELIKEGHIPVGDVDERDIQDIQPHEITQYTQQHFFAGIGGWALALRLAGWSDDRPVRTGSCPCQPFSDAGKGLAEKDPRHLWPWFRNLITFGEATVTFGEQVASKAGRLWLARVRADLEGMGYGVGAGDLCSAGIGSPNIRQRLYWMANTSSARRGRTVQGTESEARDKARMRLLGQDRRPCRLAHAAGIGRGQVGLPSSRHLEANGTGPRDRSGDGSSPNRLGDSMRGRLFEHVQRNGYEAQIASDRDTCGSDAHRSGADFWDRFDVVLCTDGKARRIEPGTFPLAHGVSGRVGLLRGYGNAINPWLAAEFILACEETLTP